MESEIRGKEKKILKEIEENYKVVLKRNRSFVKCDRICNID